MKYHSPLKISDENISSILSEGGASFDRRLQVILSAVFYSDSVEFAGDMLISEFAKSDIDKKNALLGAIGTFYQMRRTTYRIDDMLKLIKGAVLSNCDETTEFNDMVDELEEYKTIFGYVSLGR